MRCLWWPALFARAPHVGALVFAQVALRTLALAANLRHGVASGGRPVRADLGLSAADRAAVFARLGQRRVDEVLIVEKLNPFLLFQRAHRLDPAQRRFHP